MKLCFPFYSHLREGKEHKAWHARSNRQHNQDTFPSIRDACSQTIACWISQTQQQPICEPASLIHGNPFLNALSSFLLSPSPLLLPYPACEQKSLIWPHLRADPFFTLDASTSRSKQGWKAVAMAKEKKHKFHHNHQKGKTDAVEQFPFSSENFFILRLSVWQVGILWVFRQIRHVSNKTSFLKINLNFSKKTFYQSLLFSV